MTKITFSLILFFTLLTTFNSNAQIPAFPGAEGYGKYTVGGRGGQVIRVTNLNDSGPGSLREAVEASGPRTVIFDVGGRINLSSTISIDNPYITIAGQHSVGDGITLSMEGTPNKFVMRVNTSEVIIRYITFRRSSAKVSSQNSDCLYIQQGQNIIVDHCSLSWASDENLAIADYTTDSDTVGTQNITIQYNIITNAYGGNNKGTLVSDGPTRLTFFRNAWISSKTRNPAISTPTNSAANYDCYFELANNIMYDYSTSVSFNVNKPNSGVFYGNFLNNRALQEAGGNVSRKWLVFKTDNVEKAYLSGNITPLRPDDTLDEWLVAQHYNGQANMGNLPPAYKRLASPAATPIVTENVPLWNANDVWANLREHVGASLPTRDSEDTRAVSDVDNLVQTYNNVVNTFPIINNGTPLADVDDDGMPDFWEMLEYNSLDSNGVVDTDGDGYTDLEEYLNQTANGQIPDIPAESVIVTPSTATINVPDTVALSTTFTPVNTSNQSGVWTSSDPNIATVASNGLVTSVSEGVVTITFTSSSGGFTDTAEITVTNIVIPLESVSLSPTDITLEVGEESTLVATLVPTNTTDSLGTWTSSDDSVATVDENGVITGISEGLVDITYTSSNQGLTASSSVTVIDTFYGTYEFYNAFTDVLIQNIYGDTDINLADEGNEINFRSIPQGGDQDPNVESVRVDWTGPSSGSWTESGPIYAGLPNGHVGLNFEPYVVEAGTYNFTVTYFSADAAAGNVVATDTFALTFFFSSLPVANAGPDQDICEGESTTLIASGGPNFLWDNGETTAEIEVTPLVTTTYTVSVFDNDGNVDEDSVTITVNAVPVAEAGEDQTICAGETITLTASGGISYLWSTGETTETIQVSPTIDTIYDVEVASNNCSSTDNVTVFVSDAPDITVSDDLVLVEGQSTTLVANGSDNYLWSTGETTVSINVTPLVTTTYTVSSTNPNSCSTTLDVTVTVIPEVVADAGSDVTICRDEVVTLNATGGSTYLWDTGDTTAELIVTPLITTTYTVTVTDDYGYSDSDTVTITVNETPDITVSADIVIIDGDSTTLVASGGDNYQWNTGETTATIDVTPTTTTTYTVISTAVGGCADIEQVTVTVIPEVVADAGEDATICSGESITLNASGGSTYVWNTGGTGANPTVSPLITTTYTVTVEDDYGYTDTDSVTITVNETPDITVSDDIAIMDGESTTLTANGGDNYLWSTGETTASITVSPADTTTYTVSSIGTGGCEDIEQVTVTIIPELVANAGADAAICNGESITLNASGGITYTWNTGDTGAQLTVSPTVTTTYTVTVEDAFGNSDTDSVMITVNEVPNISVSDDVVIMDGESTTLSANGGSNYQWNTGETSTSITVSPTSTTTYTVSSTGAGGCEDTEQVTVTVIPALVANAGADVSICNGSSVTLNASGGTSYTWNTGETSAQITVSPSVTTNYSVTVEDNFGNSDTDSVTVTVDEMPTVTISQNITITEGESTNLVVSGAQSYQWSTGETSSTITVSPAQTTTYTVIATANTCSIQVQVTVTVEGVFEATAGENRYVCEDDTYEVVLTAGLGDSYLWSTGETTQSITVSPASTSTYTVTVTQGAQEDSDDVTVYVDPNPDVVIVNGDSVDIMNGDFITLTAEGANSYEWNNGATQPNIAVSPSVTTTYEVKGYVGDCYDEKQVTVNIIPEVVADAGDDVLICLEETATLTATGGDEYVWSTGETTQTIVVSPNVTTEYTVTVFNALDFDEDSVIVEIDTDCEDDEPEPPVGEALDFDFDVFPNPASGIVNVRLAGSDILTKIYLYDITGKLIYQSKISNDNLSISSTTQIDVSAFQKGIYYIKLVDIHRELSKKLIVN